MYHTLLKWFNNDSPNKMSLQHQTVCRSQWAQTLSVTCPFIKISFRFTPVDSLNCTATSSMCLTETFFTLSPHSNFSINAGFHKYLDDVTCKQNNPSLLYDTSCCLIMRRWLFMLIFYPKKFTCIILYPVHFQLFCKQSQGLCQPLPPFRAHNSSNVLLIVQTYEFQHLQR